MPWCFVDFLRERRKRSPRWRCLEQSTGELKICSSFGGGVFLDLKLQARKPGDKSLAVWNPGGCVLESYHVCHVNFLLIGGWG